MKKPNKRGQMDVLFIVVILFALALVVFIGNKFLGELNTAIQTDSDSTAEAKAASADITARYPAIFDAGFIMFFVLVWIAILISAWFIDTTPMFFIAALIVLAFTVIVGISLNEAYSELITDSEFNTVNTTFPMIHFILNNLALVTIIVGFSVLVVLFGKARLQQNAY